MKKVISFTIYGDNYKYTLGLIKNIEIINSKYPDWEIYIYYSNIPIFILNILKIKKNCSLFYCKPTDYKWECMFWRFYPIESDIDIMLSRDADSRITDREMILVNQWIQSKKIFHIIRDNLGHGIEIMAGMWGMRVKEFKKYKNISIDKVIKDYINKGIYPKNKMKHFIPMYNSLDQLFLKEYIYPVIKDDNMTHISSEFLRYSVEDIMISKCEENFIGKDITFTNEEIEDFLSKENLNI